jgi:flavin reductase (DIM6/NTAB) family NADH-FMN oxidoreductase RutF
VAVAPDEFKQACAHWASGVAIVTARSGERVHGMTVSAFSSVSLDPPLVLVCAEKSTNTLPFIEEGRVFAVNVLAAGQEALSNRFASKKNEWQRFDGLEWETAATGAPILSGTQACLDCRVVASHEAGDHVIYVGEVDWVRVDSGRDPLLYFAHEYGHFHRG